MNLAKSTNPRTLPKQVYLDDDLLNIKAWRFNELFSRLPFLSFFFSIILLEFSG